MSARSIPTFTTSTVKEDSGCHCCLCRATVHQIIIIFVTWKGSTLHITLTYQFNLN